jgi:exopolysaccharide production protein ExoQ
MMFLNPAARHLGPRPNAQIVSADAGVMMKYVLPVCFFACMCSVSRIGLMFVPSTTGLSWGLAYVLFAIAATQNPEVYLDMVRRNAIFLLAALFAACSAFWSLTPALSAYSGILLFMNYLVGFLLAERLGLKKTVILIFAFDLIVQCASLGLILLHHPLAFNAVGEANGLYLHKNTLSMHACLLYFSGVLLFADGWRRPIAATGIAVAIISLAVSGSGTGKILIVFTTAVLMACYIAKSGRQWSAFFAGALLIVVSVVLGVLLIGDFDISATVLKALGKDTTLTGRTILWEQALKSFAENPWLGIGYNSFWNSTETAATAIWIMTGEVLSSFHNIYLDRLVDVGAIGLFLFVASIAVLLWRSWRYFLRENSAIAAWPLAFTTYVTVLGMSEYPIFFNAEFQLFFSLAAGATSGVALRRT